jgi:hypothetical protein
MMFVVLWVAFIVLEAYAHFLIIEKLRIDPTPDGQKWYQVLPEALVRVFGLIFISLATHPSLFWIGWAVVAHLAWFGPLLNAMRGKDLDYLGNGTVDKVLKQIPFWLRIFLPFINLSIYKVLSLYSLFISF